MKSILFTYGFEDGKLGKRMQMLEDLGYKVYHEDESDFEYKDYMKEIDVLVTFKVLDKVNIDKFPNLKWIQLTSMGFEQLPKEEILERDITVTNNKNGFSIPMGEWVVLSILDLVKNRKQAHENQAKKNWHVDMSIGEIYEKTISFIGTGDISHESVKRLQGFGVTILGVNTNGRAIDGFDECFPIDELDSVLSKSDIVVITLPNTDKTYHLFDKSKLEKMKKDSYLLNMSRGAVIKEEDLVKHLEEGNLSGVALDVFEEEPLPKTSKLWEIERVVITSHNSWISDKIGPRRWEMFYENFKKFMNDEELLNVVKIKRGY